MKTRLPRHATALVALLFAVARCSGGPPPADAGVDTSVATDVVGADHASGDGATVCESPAICDDGLFCNGPEQCAPGTAGADPRGCVHGTAPCTAMQTCTESTRACVPITCTHGATPDMDGDGHATMACGGDDCDDTDPHRFPGNAEVCLAVLASDGTTFTRSSAAMGLDPAHDEDCDPTTFSSATSHDGDHDADGYVDVGCANTDSTGMVHRGTDCDDLNLLSGVPASAIHPTQPEVCNGVDDNCNAEVDEGDPGGGGACASRALGVCAAGVNHCQAGALACVAPTASLPLTCCAGSADCDADATNGCETATASDAHHCGACGNACAPAVGGTATCVAGVCGQACPAPEVACAGSCQNLTLGCNNGMPGFCARSGTLVCSGAGTTCTLAAPTPPSMTWLDGSPALAHACGSTEDAASDVTTAPCYLQYGPYTALPAGNYTVTFNVNETMTGPGSTYPLTTFDVNTASGVVASQTFTHGFVGATPVVLTFTITEACATSVEFRVSISGWVTAAGTTCHFGLVSTVLTSG